MWCCFCSVKVVIALGDILVLQSSISKMVTSSYVWGLIFKVLLMGITDENTVASDCPKQSAWDVPKQNGELMPFHLLCARWMPRTSSWPDWQPTVTAKSCCPGVSTFLLLWPSSRQGAGISASLKWVHYSLSVETRGKIDDKNAEVLIKLLWPYSYMYIYIYVCKPPKVF